jgi:hypothetical protein
MKRVLASKMKGVLPGASGLKSVMGGGGWSKLVSAKKAKVLADTTARAQKNTPAYNATDNAAVPTEPPSQEELRRRKASTLLTSTDKLG